MPVRSFMGARPVLSCVVVRRFDGEPLLRTTTLDRLSQGPRVAGKIGRPSSYVQIAFTHDQWLNAEGWGVIGFVLILAHCVLYELCERHDSPAKSGRLRLYPL